jgi:hypothetical protein
MSSKGIVASPERHAAFARRLVQTCDSFGVPDLHHGRLKWIADQLEEQFALKVSNETVRKWLSGEARPREGKISVLAQLFLVDEAWLSLGNTLDSSMEQRRLRFATAESTILLVAAFVGFAGGAAAFPEPNDPRIGEIDLYAIIKGAQYAFKVVPGKPAAGGSVVFEIPGNYKNAFVLGVIETASFRYDLVELDAETVAKHRQMGQSIKIVARKRGALYTVGNRNLRSIKSLSERL